MTTMSRKYIVPDHWYNVEIKGKQSDNWATHFLQDAASV